MIATKPVFLTEEREEEEEEERNNQSIQHEHVTTKKQRCLDDNDGDMIMHHTSLKQIISDCISFETSWKQLSSFEDQGIIETYLWPIFLKTATSTIDETIKKDKEIYSKAAFAIARVIYKTCHISSSSNRRMIMMMMNETTVDSPLSFIYHHQKEQHDKNETLMKNQSLVTMDGFQIFFHSLLKYFFQNNSTDITHVVNNESSSSSSLQQSVQVQVIILSFLMTMIQAMEPPTYSSSSSLASSKVISIITPTLQSMTSIGLWTYMPSHIREYHLRCNTTFAQRWNKFISSSLSNHQYDNEKITHDDNEIVKAFIPLLAQLFLQRLQLVQNEEEEDDENHHMTCMEDILLPFFHCTLQFFIDLLSIPSTRRYLRRYLLSIHLSVSCICCRLYHHDDFDKNYNKTSAAAAATSHSRVLFIQLVKQLQDLENFGLDDITGAPYNSNQMKTLYLERATILQKMIHTHYTTELPDLMYASVEIIISGEDRGISGNDRGNIHKKNSSSFLRKQLDQVGSHWEKVLLDLAHRLRLVDHHDSQHPFLGQEKNNSRKREFVTQILLYHHILQPSESQRLQSLPLFPDETLLWNPYLVPPGDVSFVSPTVTTLALPKINSHFLSFGDYLVRFFTLLRLESAYEIRLDLVDAIRRMKPTVSSRHSTYDRATVFHPTVQQSSKSSYGSFLHIPTITEERLETISNHKSKTEFHGWARMGLELSTSSPFRIVKISPPKLGENIPSQVIGEFCWDLSRCSEGLRKEWDDVREMDNLFLIAVDATAMISIVTPMIDDEEEGNDNQLPLPDEEDGTFPKRYGVLAVRGCTVIEIRDDVGNVLNSSMSETYEENETANKPMTKTYLRFFKVALDPAQYAADLSGQGSSLGSEVYSFLNIVVRRQGKENHFKAVLETVRGLLVGAGSINKCIPPWLRPVILGYGDPSSVSYNSKQMIAYGMKTVGTSSVHSVLDFCDTFLDIDHLRESFPSSQVIVDGKFLSDLDTTFIKNYRLKIPLNNLHNTCTAPIAAESYHRSTQFKGNTVRFTPVQIEAIRSGLSTGLTLIVGPPGTGKTDVAVQIIASLFHTFPSERTIIITHSNAALNDIFEKVASRGDIDERYMLRLGSGERDLQISPHFDFSKVGRVKYSLSRRMQLLEMVQLLSESLGISGILERGTDGSPSYTCETAEYFRIHHVEKLMTPLKSTMESLDNIPDADFYALFPFKPFFGIDKQIYMNIHDVKEKFTTIDAIFLELSEYRPLELLRSQKQRSDYLITQQARIVAMTCTYAAIMRSNLVELGFQYDNVIIEEAGQMLDIETFIPLLLQSGNVNATSNSSNKLKRISLIGDHHQLPPVVKNTAIARHSRLDQSLFGRLIYQGVHYIQLDKQGRARPELALLYSWRYMGLDNLDFVSSAIQYKTANAGFAYTHQLIDCGDFNGRGESAPTAFFYQNVGEAEYAVAIFQYMVMIGYPPDKITLLTTYNGQRDLLIDILSRRCGEGTPLVNVRPGAVSTVDQYQGQQNDYIILSLVRTRAVGHLRDVRRLIVAMSRARLGLYVLCREKLFLGCRELNKCIDLLKKFPSKLTLVAGEHYPTERRNLEKVDDQNIFVVEDIIQMGKLVYEMQNDLYAGVGRQDE